MKKVFWLASLALSIPTFSLASDSSICTGGKSQVHYMGTTLLMAEPTQTLSINHDAESGALDIASDEGAGIEIRINPEKREVQITQDPLFGKMQKTIRCSMSNSREICAQYMAKASELLSRAQFQMSETKNAAAKMHSLNCAQKRVDLAIQKLEEDPSRALSSM